MYGEDWAEAAQVSTKTLQRFWECKPIRRGNFIAICNAIDVDWQKVTEGSKTKEGTKYCCTANLRSPPKFPAISLFQTPAKFVGREADILHLDELLTSNGQVAVCTTGMGGVGKTELALQYGRRHIHKIPRWCLLAFCSHTRSGHTISSLCQQTCSRSSNSRG